MRLSSSQVSTIKSVVAQTLDPGAQVWLFGSRVDDAKRGGDVDLYVQTTHPVDLAQELLCKVRLKEGLDLGVDMLLAQEHQHSAIGQIARFTGVQL